MRNGTEARTQTLDSSSHMIELRLKKELEMDTQGIEISADEISLRLFHEQIDQTIDLAKP